MAYTTPRTWVSGELVTAALMNTHVRDNIAFVAKFRGVKAVRTTDFNINNDVDTAIQYNAADIFDTDGFHDPATNNTRLTCPTGLGGYYLVAAEVHYAPDAVGFRRVSLRYNGATVISRSQDGNPDASRDISIFTETVVFLNPTDYVEVIARQNSGGTLAVRGTDAGSARFEMHWVGLA
jgi:hypothetical protein